MVQSGLLLGTVRLVGRVNVLAERARRIAADRRVRMVGGKLSHNRRDALAGIIRVGLLPADVPDRMPDARQVNKEDWRGLSWSSFVLLVSLPRVAVVLHRLVVLPEKMSVARPNGAHCSRRPPAHSMRLSRVPMRTDSRTSYVDSERAVDRIALKSNGSRNTSSSP